MIPQCTCGLKDEISLPAAPPLDSIYGRHQTSFLYLQHLSALVNATYAAPFSIEESQFVYKYERHENWSNQDAIEE